MAFDPTPAQAAAIKLNQTDLLVSAAAGSGKTATLIERIYRHITDPVDPCSVTDILVVTFTKDSATDLVAKLSKKLSEALSENPDDRHLAAQLLKVRSADVSTIHSFCMRVLRPNFHRLGLPADFRVGDEGEILMLRRRQMRHTLEDFYEADPATLDFSFTNVVDTLSHIKNEEALSDVLLKLHDKLTAYPEGIARLLTLSDVPEGTEFFDTVYGERLRRVLCRFADHYTAVFTDALACCAANPPFDTKYTPAFEDDLRFLRELRRDVAAGYEAAAARINNVAHTSLGTVRGVAKPEELEFFLEQRDKYKAYLKKLKQDYTDATLAAIAAASRENARLCYGIYRILEAFDKAFGKTKRSMGLCDYGDLERYTYSLLIGEDGKPTPLAREVGGRYREIYVDEYQDTNELQDAIFRAIGNGHNRFMVGDIKQSIYRFRGADSAVFASYRRVFPTFRPGMDVTADGLCVFMSDNFRCDKPVIDFSNAISRFMFHATDGVPFTEDDELRFSKKGDTAELPVDVYVFEKRDGEDEDAECVEEAAFIAGEIRRMLDGERKADGSPYTPGDFAVLCRSPKHLGPELIRRLTEMGVPVQSKLSEKFFERPEILLVLCLLNAIDNPLRDTYLAGALCSPIFGFTLDELVQIRRQNPTAYSLYDALCAAEGVAEEKIRLFLKRLDGYRALARQESADRLLRHLYEDTGLLSHLSTGAGGAAMRKNLLRLYHYARVYESGGFKGLYRFLAYLTSIQDEEIQTVSGGANSVTLTTIHKSKGMEFAVCFLADLARPFNEMIAREAVVYDDEVGFTAKLLGGGGVAHVNTVHRMCALRSTLDAERLEGMRVLYVAMTRAKSKLILTGTVAHPTEELALCRNEAPYADAHWFCDRTRTFLRWVLAGIYKEQPDCARLFVGDAEGNVVGEIPAFYRAPEGAAEATLRKSPPSQNEAAAAVGAPATADAVACGREAPAGREARVRRLQERYDYTYPHAHLESLPAKLTVSKLTPTALDEWSKAPAPPVTEELLGEDALYTDEDTVTDRPDPYEDLLTPPAFLQGERKATGAEAGTATHVFLQFCDLARLKANGPRAELDRLVAEKFLPEELAALVRLSDIGRFLRSDLFRKMEVSTLRREFRFNLLLPAEQFSADVVRRARMTGERVLVQGVIDCLMFLPNGEYLLIDYKTDYLTAEERENKALAAEKLRARHKNQLTYYAQACAEMLGRPPQRVLIYSVPLGDTVEVL